MSFHAPAGEDCDEPMRFVVMLCSRVTLTAIQFSSLECSEILQSLKAKREKKGLGEVATR